MHLLNITYCRMQKVLELGEVSTSLESITEEATRLRAQNEELQTEVNELTERRSWVEGLHAELEATNARNARLETENRNLRWEACR